MPAFNLDQELDTLYGNHVLPHTGIVHTVHAVRAPSGRLHALRIDENAPRSETDWFVLSLCRARADAVLTSAENLRREPRLVHTLTGPWAPRLRFHRTDILAKPSLACAILTRSGNLPTDHPVWSDGTRKLLLCAPAAETALRTRFADQAEVIPVPDLNAAAACALLTQLGLPLISVEAGPSTAAGLYTGPTRVSELWLTLWENAASDAALAGALPDDATLFAGLARVGASVREEHGQRFRFEQWRRVEAI